MAGPTDAAARPATRPTPERTPRAFDNRTALDRSGLRLPQRAVDRAMGWGRNHFVVEVGDVRIAYCYIRKNACTSFKRLFMDHPPKGAKAAAELRPIDFMRRHMLLEERARSDCDAAIFVYRDPVERILSLYRNKFIAREGNSDLFSHFHLLTGMDPGRASLRSFVERYFRKRFIKLDRHVLPQRLHLQRMVYTHPTPIGALHRTMSSILGAGLADEYFRAPENATRMRRTEAVSGAADLPAEALTRRFRASGALPSDDSLLDDDLRRGIERIYRMDVALIDTLQAGS